VFLNVVNFADTYMAIDLSNPAHHQGAVRGTSTRRMLAHIPH
jgi:hypothetical protein